LDEIGKIVFSVKKLYSVFGLLRFVYKFTHNDVLFKLGFVLEVIVVGILSFCNRDKIDRVTFM
jgi:hypothetical protein